MKKISDPLYLLALTVKNERSAKFSGFNFKKSAYFSSLNL
jgi:hypothetical protein